MNRTTIVILLAAILPLVYHIEVIKPGLSRGITELSGAFNATT